jgi:Asp-tRNA(Asn)/Glu-tRNA(Gln) amidotransferase A subunit family amidase
MRLPESLVDRMRTNLAAAGITAAEADVQGIIEGKNLELVAAFEERAARWPDGAMPDYLAAIGEPPPDTDSQRDRPPGERGEPRAGHRVAPQRDSIVTVAERIRTREISPVELTEGALRRIEARDRILNVFQQVLAERALASARRAEKEIAAGDYRGPLHGVPVAVKDLLALSGTETTAGSRILAGQLASSDAAAVERLAAAGAVLVGRTRMSEFAYFPGSQNAHYGPTRNPADPERDAGGSSSGSAVAVAEGMAHGAIGSDTGGSIRIPAAFCGVVGLKPTFGRVSLHGAVPLSWSLDHLGPLTRTVADAALLLEVLAGADPRDPRTRQVGRPAVPAELEAGVYGLRIGVPAGERLRTALGSVEVWAAVERPLAALESAGAVQVPVELPELEDLWLINLTILALEASSFHEPWLRSRLADYGEIPRRRLLAAYAHAPGAFVRAQRARHAMRRRMQTLFARVDLLAMPAQPAGAPPLGAPGWTLPTGPFNALGWPALSVPVGFTSTGLPLALQLVGASWDEATLLRAGRAVEIATTDW